jgi:hypothetical protein
VVLGLFLLAATQPIPRWIGAVYAIVGAVVLGYPTLLYTTGLSFLSPSIRYILPFKETLLQPLRGASLMGAFILAIGVWMLVRRSPAADDPSG